MKGMYLEIKHVCVFLSHPPFESRNTLAILFSFSIFKKRSVEETFPKPLIEVTQKQVSFQKS
jgi:hypothetical protein